MLGTINHVSSPEDSEVVYRRVDDWGWRTWKTVKSQDPKSHGRSGSLCLAEVFAKLVRESCSVSSDCGDEKFQEGIWTDKVAVTELMVSLHIYP